MQSKIKGYIINQQEYKDNDYFLDILSEVGIVRVLGRGLKKITSKNRAATQLFTLGEYHYNYKSENSLKILTTANIIKSNVSVHNDLLLIAQLSLISELIIKNFATSNFYFEFTDLIRNKTWLDLCWIFKKMIVISGFKPELNCCSNCGASVVIGFSFDGGYICHNCWHSYDFKLTPKQMRLLHYLFKANFTNKDSLKEYAYDYFIFDLLLKYYLHHQPQNLKSYNFFNKIVDKAS
ncbi:MAG: DNA repair protein RecO [Erysipelotrichaceae bacterium]